MPDDVNLLWNAAVSTPEALERLRERLEPSAWKHDLYLAYSGNASAQFLGYLVTAREMINRLIAFLPVNTDFCVASTAWLIAVAKQFNLALQVARSADCGRRSPQVVWLDQSQGREMPPWVYSLACVPLSVKWDGVYRYPRPFCPRLFRSMAEQPEARTWMQRQLDAVAQIDARPGLP